MATTNPMMHFLLHSEGKLAIRPKFLDLLMNYDWRLGINSTLTQIPQPMHSSSEMSADLDFGPTSMQCFPAKKQTIQFVRMQFHARKPFLEKRWPYLYSLNQTIQQFRTCLLHCSLHFQVSREISAGAYRSSRRGSFVCTPVHTF